MSADRSLPHPRDWLRTPRSWLPFAAAGLLLALLTVWRLSIPVPAGNTAFPAEGIFRYRGQFLPGGASPVDVPLAALRGLKPIYLLGLLGQTLLGQAVLAVVGAVACTRLFHGRRWPAPRTVGWLLAYGLAGSLLWFGTMLAATVPGVPTALIALVLLPVPLVLFLTPAVIVAEGSNPLSAMRRAAGLFARRPLRTTGAAVGVTYLGYLLTGVVAVVGTGSVLGYAVATAVSTTVGGTVYAAVMVRSYRRAIRVRAKRERQPAPAADRGDD